MLIPYLENFFTLPTLTGIVLIAISAGLMANFCMRRANLRALGTIMALAAFLDIIVLAVQMNVSRVLVGDAQTWHRLGSLAADFLTGRTNEAVSYVSGKEGYIWILGGLYSVTGPAPMAAIAFGVFCHLVTIAAVTLSCHRIAEVSGATSVVAQKATRNSALLAAVLPCFVWWSPQVLRESLTLALVSVAIYMSLTLVATRRIRILVLIVPVLGLLVWVRGSLGGIVSIAIAVALVFVAVGTSKYSLLLRIVLVGGALLLFSSAQAQLGSVIDAATDTAALATTELSSIASSGFGGLGSHAALSDLLQVTAPRVLAGPFVWEFSPTSVMVLAFAELACWIFVIIFALRGLDRFRSGKVMHSGAWAVPIILIVTVAILFGLMMTVGNYGILARFRPIATMLLIPIAGIGLLHVRSFRANDATPERQSPLISGGGK